MINRDYIGEYVPINGLETYIHTYPRPGKPVLLFLHGGPGGSNVSMAYRHEEMFGSECTLVDYDQRGAGRTALRSPDVYPDLEQMLLDLGAVIAYLKEKYSVEKVILMGHSWGTVLGSIYALRHPEDLLCYIGMGQVVNMIENERVGRAELLKRIDAAGAAADRAKVEALGADYPCNEDGSVVEKNIYAMRKIQRKYKLAVPIDLKAIVTMLRSPAFRLSDFKAIKLGVKLASPLLECLLAFDLPSLGTKYDIPVYYVMGDRDWQTPYPVAVEYFGKIEAPNKRLYMIKDAGHATTGDNPKDSAAAMLEIIAEVSK